MRLIFMGTPDFAVPTLKAVAQAGHEIAAVYSQPPRRAGRGKKERKSAVHLAAESLGLAVFTPQSMKTETAATEFASHHADLAVVVAYGQILPQIILDTPKYGCVNVHASLLPRWRGAAPIHRAIMAGDQKTGVCIMQMEAGLDTGPVFACAETSIGPKDTTASLHDRLAAQGAELIGGVISDLVAGTVVAEPQAGEGITYAKKIEKAEARINWQVPAGEIDRQVRGLYPFPGAWFMCGGERIKILAGELCAQSGTPGTVLDKDLTIACNAQSYRPLRVQKAGKAPIDTKDFLRGMPVPIGTRLE